VEIQYFSDSYDNLKLPGFVTLTNQIFRSVTFTVLRWNLVGDQQDL